jgi:hypothetical protein
MLTPRAAEVDALVGQVVGDHGLHIVEYYAEVAGARGREGLRALGRGKAKGRP